MDPSTVQIQILSDLHLETPSARPSYDDIDIPPQASCLALLGDIRHVADARLFQFLERQLSVFATVLYVLGNHEPYGTSYPAARERMRDFERQYQGKFVLMDRTRLDVGNVTVLGCTLFSHVVPEQRQSVGMFVSDFENISDWTVDAHNTAHEVDLQWLNEQVAHCEPHRSIVILTHYCPTALDQAADPKHVRDANGVRSAFSTDLSTQLSWTSPKVKVWAFGHTHFNCDFADPLTGKRVVANQKGYRRSECVDFSPTKVVGIDVGDPDRSRTHRNRCTVS